MIPRDSRLTRHPNCLTNGVHLNPNPPPDGKLARNLTEPSRPLSTATEPEGTAVFHAAVPIP